MTKDINLPALYLQVGGDTPYDIIGVGTWASADDVRIAYRQIALILHPDKAPPEKQKLHTVLFQVVQNAYEKLLAEMRRGNEEYSTRENARRENPTRENSKEKDPKEKCSKCRGSKCRGSAWYKYSYYPDPNSRRESSTYNNSKDKDSKDEVPTDEIPKSKDSKTTGSAWEEEMYERFNKHKGRRRRGGGLDPWDNGPALGGSKPRRRNGGGTKKDSPFNHGPVKKSKLLSDEQPDAEAVPQLKYTYYPAKLHETCTTDSDEETGLVLHADDGVEECVVSCTEDDLPVQAARVDSYDWAETAFPEYTWYPGVHEAQVKIDRSFPPAEPYIHDADDFPTLSEAMGL